MLDEQNKIKEVIQYYKEQNAAKDQQVLIELLREIQEIYGGVIPDYAIEEAAGQLEIKRNFLNTVISRYGSLRTEDAPHRMEVCKGDRCQKQGGALLRTFIEKEYHVKNGGISKTGRFSYQTTGCMKNCAKGPNIRWDGKLYEGADMALIKRLTGREEV